MAKKKTQPEPPAERSGADVQPEVEQPQEAGLQVTGLAASERMVIQFRNRAYDLANLTEAEAEYLRQFPRQVPYLVPKEDVIS